MHFNYMKYITLTLLIFVLLFALKKYTGQSYISTLHEFTNSELPIYCVQTNNKQLALTFDSAWGTEDLDQILQILEQYQVTATFFVTGQWAKEHPDAIIKIDQAGHELGNHGMNHKHMPQLSKDEIKKEITDCDATVSALTGKNMNVFRAPYSDWNDLVVDTAKECGYWSINQSVDSLDWKDYGIDAIIQRVCNHKNLENGAILLLHNGSKYTKDALSPMLSALKEDGYSFVPVSQLIYKENYYIDHTGKQFDQSEKK